MIGPECVLNSITGILNAYSLSHGRLSWSMFPILKCNLNHLPPRRPPTPGKVSARPVVPETCGTLS